MSDNYNQNSITALRDEDQVRKKVAVIFGTNDSYGAAHGIYEIIANSIDEAREGYGKQIRISIRNDGEVEVSDDGRGVPMEWNEVEQKFNWELVFCTLYASGKYDSSSYGGALGTNGLGATSMQYASEYFDVWSTRDGGTCHMHFEKGRPVGQLEKTAPIRTGTGTTIRFKPDPEVFTGILSPTGLIKVMPPEYYLNLLRRQAMLHSGLEIVFHHDELDSEIRICYPDGIKGFVDAICEKSILKKPIYFENATRLSNNEGMMADQMAEAFNFSERCAFNFSREASFIELYHNGSHLYEGGVTSDAMAIGITKGFEDVAKANNKIRSNEKLSYRDIESMLVFIGDTNAPGYQSYFKNQTKAALTNSSFYAEYKQFIYNCIRNWCAADKDAVLKVIDEILVNKRAREEAEKVSKKVVSSLSKSVTGIGNKPKKFVDCKSRNKDERELWIVEGDSAAGSCKLARDANTQAIMPVRGKIINCLKEDLSRVLNSDIIIDLLRVMGCGIEAKSKYIRDLPKFDLDKLNFAKVIICTDADIDGMQIRCLVLTMLYRLCPTLLKKNRVFIAETPLFEIRYKKDTEFAYTEEEKEAILIRYQNMGIDSSKLKISRSKGLGENDPDMMNVSTMNPNSRRLVPIQYDEADEQFIADTFEVLLGSDIEGRRNIIEEYFSLTNVDIE